MPLLVEKRTAGSASTGQNTTAQTSAPSLRWTPAQRKEAIRDSYQYSWTGKTAEQMTPLEKASVINMYVPDNTKKRSMLNELFTGMGDIYSSSYSPYNLPGSTQKEAKAFFGVDSFSQQWIDDNRFLLQYTTQNDFTDSFSTSGKANWTQQQWAGYYYYQILKAEEDTKTAESEWKQMRSDLQSAYDQHVKLYGKAPSYEQLMGYINTNDYSMLNRMDGVYADPANLVRLNRSVPYSKEALTGVYADLLNGEDIAADRDWFADAVGYVSTPVTKRDYVELGDSGSVFTETEHKQDFLDKYSWLDDYLKYDMYGSVKAPSKSDGLLSQAAYERYRWQEAWNEELARQQKAAMAELKAAEAERKAAEKAAEAERKAAEAEQKAAEKAAEAERKAAEKAAKAAQTRLDNRETMRYKTGKKMLEKQEIYRNTIDLRTQVNALAEEIRSLAEKGLTPENIEAAIQWDNYPSVKKLRGGSEVEQDASAFADKTYYHIADFVGDKWLSFVQKAAGGTYEPVDVSYSDSKAGDGNDGFRYNPETKQYELMNEETAIEDNADPVQDASPTVSPTVSASETPAPTVSDADSVSLPTPSAQVTPVPNAASEESVFDNVDLEKAQELIIKQMNAGPSDSDWWFWKTGLGKWLKPEPDSSTNPLVSYPGKSISGKIDVNSLFDPEAIGGTQDAQSTLFPTPELPNGPFVDLTGFEPSPEAEKAAAENPAVIEAEKKAEIKALMDEIQVQDNKDAAILHQFYQDNGRIPTLPECEEMGVHLYAPQMATDEVLAFTTPFDLAEGESMFGAELDNLAASYNHPQTGQPYANFSELVSCDPALVGSLIRYAGTVPSGSYAVDESGKEIISCAQLEYLRQLDDYQKQIDHDDILGLFNAYAEDNGVSRGKYDAALEYFLKQPLTLEERASLSTSELDRHELLALNAERMRDMNQYMTGDGAKAAAMGLLGEGASLDEIELVGGILSNVVGAEVGFASGLLAPAMDFGGLFAKLPGYLWFEIHKDKYSEGATYDQALEYDPVLKALDVTAQDFDNFTAGMLPDTSRLGYGGAFTAGVFQSAGRNLSFSVLGGGNDTLLQKYLDKSGVNTAISMLPKPVANVLRFTANAFAGSGRWIADEMASSFVEAIDKGVDLDTAVSYSAYSGMTTGFLEGVMGQLYDAGTAAVGGKIVGKFGKGFSMAADKIGLNKFVGLMTNAFGEILEEEIEIPFEEWGNRLLGEEPQNILQQYKERGTQAALSAFAGSVLTSLLFGIGANVDTDPQTAEEYVSAIRGMSERDAALYDEVLREQEAARQNNSAQTSGAEAPAVSSDASNVVSALTSPEAIEAARKAQNQMDEEAARQMAEERAQQDYAEGYLDKYTVAGSPEQSAVDEARAKVDERQAELDQLNQRLETLKADQQAAMQAAVAMNISLDTGEIRQTLFNLNEQINAATNDVAEAEKKLEECRRTFDQNVARQEHAIEQAKSELEGQYYDEILAGIQEKRRTIAESAKELAGQLVDNAASNDQSYEDYVSARDSAYLAPQYASRLSEINERIKKVKDALKRAGTPFDRDRLKATLDNLEQSLKSLKSRAALDYSDSHPFDGKPDTPKNDVPSTSPRVKESSYAGTSWTENGDNTTVEELDVPNPDVDAALENNPNAFERYVTLDPESADTQFLKDQVQRANNPHFYELYKNELFDRLKGVIPTSRLRQDERYSAYYTAHNEWERRRKAFDRKQYELKQQFEQVNPATDPELFEVLRRQLDEPFSEPEPRMPSDVRTSDEVDNDVRYMYYTDPKAYKEAREEALQSAAKTMVDELIAKGLQKGAFPEEKKYAHDALRNSEKAVSDQIKAFENPEDPDGNPYFRASYNHHGFFDHFFRNTNGAFKLVSRTPDGHIIIKNEAAWNEWKDAYDKWKRNGRVGKKPAAPKGAFIVLDVSARDNLDFVTNQNIPGNVASLSEQLVSQKRPDMSDGQSRLFDRLVAYASEFGSDRYALTALDAAWKLNYLDAASYDYIAGLYDGAVKTLASGSVDSAAILDGRKKSNSAYKCFDRVVQYINLRYRAMVEQLTDEFEQNGGYTEAIRHPSPEQLSSDQEQDREDEHLDDISDHKAVAAEGGESLQYDIKLDATSKGFAAVRDKWLQQLYSSLTSDEARIKAVNDSAVNALSQLEEYINDFSEQFNDEVDAILDDWKDHYRSPRSAETMRERYAEWQKEAEKQVLARYPRYKTALLLYEKLADSLKKTRDVDSTSRLNTFAGAFFSSDLKTVSEYVDRAVDSANGLAKTDDSDKLSRALRAIHDAVDQDFTLDKALETILKTGYLPGEVEEAAPVPKDRYKGTTGFDWIDSMIVGVYNYPDQAQSALGPINQSSMDNEVPDYQLKMQAGVFDRLLDAVYSGQEFTTDMLLGIVRESDERTYLPGTAYEGRLPSVNPNYECVDSADYNGCRVNLVMRKDMMQDVYQNPENYFNVKENGFVPSGNEADIQTVADAEKFLEEMFDVYMSKTSLYDHNTIIVTGYDKNGKERTMNLYDYLSGIPTRLTSVSDLFSRCTAINVYVNNDNGENFGFTLEQEGLDPADETKTNRIIEGEFRNALSTFETYMNGDSSSDAYKPQFLRTFVSAQMRNLQDRYKRLQTDLLDSGKQYDSQTTTLMMGEMNQIEQAYNAWQYVNDMVQTFSSREQDLGLAPGQELAQRFKELLPTLRNADIGTQAQIVNQITDAFSKAHTIPAEKRQDVIDRIKAASDKIDAYRDRMAELEVTANDANTSLAALRDTLSDEIMRVNDEAMAALDRLGLNNGHSVDDMRQYIGALQNRLEAAQKALETASPEEAEGLTKLIDWCRDKIASGQDELGISEDYASLSQSISRFISGAIDDMSPEAVMKAADGISALLDDYQANKARRTQAGYDEEITALQRRIDETQEAILDDAIEKQLGTLSEEISDETDNIEPDAPQPVTEAPAASGGNSQPDSHFEQTMNVTGNEPVGNSEQLPGDSTEHEPVENEIDQSDYIPESTKMVDQNIPTETGPEKSSEQPEQTKQSEQSQIESDPVRETLKNIPDYFEEAKRMSPQEEASYRGDELPLDAFVSQFSSEKGIESFTDAQMNAPVTVDSFDDFQSLEGKYQKVEGDIETLNHRIDEIADYLASGLAENADSYKAAKDSMIALRNQLKQMKQKMRQALDESGYMRTAEAERIVHDAVTYGTIPFATVDARTRDIEEMRGKLGNVRAMLDKYNEFGKLTVLSDEELSRIVSGLVDESVLKQNHQIGMMLHKMEKAATDELKAYQDESVVKLNEARESKASSETLDQLQKTYDDGIAIRKAAIDRISTAKIAFFDHGSKYSISHILKGTDGGRMPIPVMNAVYAMMKDVAVQGKGRPMQKFVQNTTDAARVIRSMTGPYSKVFEALYIAPVKANENDRLDRVRELRNTLAESGVTEKNQEDAMKFYEGKMSLDDLSKKYRPEEVAEIQRGKTVINDMLNELLSQINKARKRNGFGEIPALEVPEGTIYIPHTIEDDGFLSKLLSEFGLSLDQNEVPASMAGSTADTHARKGFESYAMKREGEATSYKMLENIAKYIEAATKVIYHTDDLNRLRQFEGMAVDKGDVITPRSEINAGMRQFEKYAGAELKNATAAAYFNRLTEWLQLYTDDLSGKSGRMTRSATETVVNRSTIQLFNELRKISARAMVGGNLSTAVTNVIPITEMMAIDPQATMKGIGHAMADLCSGKIADYEAQSKFLTGRFSDSKLHLGFGEKLDSVLYLPAEKIDHMAAYIVNNAYYQMALKRGLPSDLAHKQADALSEAMMASNNRGSRGVLYDDPIPASLLQFSREGMNNFHFVGKDLKEIKGSGLGALMSALVMQVLGFLFNQATGKTSAPELITPVINSVNGWQTSDENGSHVLDNMKTVGSNVLEAVNPFAMESISLSEIPVFSTVSDTASSLMKGNFSDALTSLFTGFCPAGSQINKWIRAGKLYAKGYSEDSKGNITFTVDNSMFDSGYDIYDALIAFIIGPNATIGGRKYAESGYQAYTPTQSDAMRQMMENGMSSRQAQEQVDIFTDVTGGRNAAKLIK